MNIPKISKVLNITKPTFDYNDVYKIKFYFTKKLHNSFHIVNAQAFDTESSNGFQLKGTNEVVGFDQEKYDNGVINEINNVFDEDTAYKLIIDDAKPVGIIYLWTYAIEDGQGGVIVFAGRTWDDYLTFQYKLNQEIKRQSVFGFDSVDRVFEEFEANASKNRCYNHIFVHNLGHDWQFMRSIFNDEFSNSKRKGGSVFARKARKPMKAGMNLNGVNVTYHDTAVLSQKSLKNLAKDCVNCPLEKLDDFDYLTIKTPLDTLTDEELHYACNDVLILVYYIEDEREKAGSIEEIAITQTGKVRKVCKERVCAQNKDWEYNCSLISKSYTPDEFALRVQLYQGGYTHANSFYVGDVVYCHAYDFASSYPSCCCNGRFPIFGYDECSVDEFDELEQQDIEDCEYRWFAKIKLYNVRSILLNTYWSFSKAIDIKDAVVDNGRIVECSEMTIVAMDLDWYTFKKAYAFDDFEVLKLEKGIADYLPTELVTTMLDYYAKKTSLKGLDDRLSEYQESKEFINAGSYGVFCYKQFSDQISFKDGDWQTESLDENGDEMFYDLVQEISETGLFGFYDIGITISALARKRLWDLVSGWSDNEERSKMIGSFSGLDERCVYMDTDSLKGCFTDEDTKAIESYNEWIVERCRKAADYHGISIEMYRPKTIKGKSKQLGILEQEPSGNLKTLGAKRYVVEHDGEFECTIAGLPKYAGKAKIKSFDDFTNNTLWTTKESGKVCVYYNDNQDELKWIGRDGETYISNDKYGVCLKPVTFDMRLSDEFYNFLKMLVGLNAEALSDRTTPAFFAKKVRNM